MSASLILQFQNMINSSYTEFAKTKNVNGLLFVAEAILQNKDLAPGSLGCPGILLLHALTFPEVKAGAVEKIDRLRKVIQTNSWQERFIEASLQDPDPLDIPTLIKEIGESDTPFLPPLLKKQAFRCIRYAKVAQATQLIDVILRKSDITQNTWRGEVFGNESLVCKLMQKGTEGDIIRETTRGVVYYKRNSDVLFRFLPEVVRQSLDTVYLSSFQNPLPNIVADFKGVLPISRVVFEQGIHDDGHSWFFPLLTEFSDISEVVICTKWSLPEGVVLSEECKRHLKTIAFELDNVQIEGKELQNFVSEFFAIKLDNLNSRVSLRFEPEGWKRKDHKKIDSVFATLEKSSSFICTLGPTLVAQAEHNEDLKTHILDAFGVFEGYSSKLNFTLARDAVVGPHILKWLEERWNKKEISTSDVVMVLDWWGNCSETVPFPTHQMTTSDNKIIEVPELPLKAARDALSDALPTKTSCSSRGLTKLANFLGAKERYYEQQKWSPQDWIECASAAIELQIATFWKQSYIPIDPLRWSVVQIAELKATVPESWFFKAVCQIAHGSSSERYCGHLTEKQWQESQKTAWKDEINALFSGIKFMQSPLQDCQELAVKDSAIFLHIRKLLWTIPDFTQWWAIETAIKKLTNVKKIRFEHARIYQAPPLTSESLECLFSIDSEIKVISQNSVLDLDEVAKITNFGKRSRDKAPIILRAPRFVRLIDGQKVECEPQNLEQTPFVIEVKK